MHNVMPPAPSDLSSRAAIRYDSVQMCRFVPASPDLSFGIVMGPKQLQLQSRMELVSAALIFNCHAFYVSQVASY